MKPVFHVPLDGECLRACVASLLELPFEVVPSFNCPGDKYDPEARKFKCTIPEHYRGEYATCGGGTEQDRRIQQFVEPFGLRYTCVRMNYYGREAGPTQGRLMPPGLCIASGASPRGSWNHVVVWDTRLRDFEHPIGRMVHDPYPAPPGERPGIGPVEEFSYFEVEDPSRLYALANLRPSPAP